MDGEIEIDPQAVTDTITGYTREAGGDEARPIQQHIIGSKDVPAILGPEIFENDLLDQVGRPGVATGLARTPTGGEALMVEASKMTGTGQMRLTGSTTSTCTSLRVQSKRTVQVQEWRSRWLSCQCFG